MRVINIVRYHTPKKRNPVAWFSHRFKCKENKERCWTSVCVMWNAGSRPVAGIPAELWSQEDQGGVQELWGDDAKMCLFSEGHLECEGTRRAMQIRNWCSWLKWSLTVMLFLSHRCGIVQSSSLASGFKEKDYIWGNAVSLHCCAFVFLERRSVWPRL